MANRFGSAVVVVVSTGVAICGLMMIGSVGPSPAGAQRLGTLLVPPESTTTSTLAPEPTTTSTLAPEPTTTSTTTSTTSTLAQPSPVPLSVTSPSQGPDGVVVVGAGGSISIEGTCWVVDGQPLGPVELWVLNGSTDVIETGMRAAHWIYEWTAPPERGVVAIQVWCGDPEGFQGGYPLARQLAINIVEVGPPPTSPMATTAASNAPIVSIPETD